MRALTLLSSVGAVSVAVLAACGGGSAEPPSAVETSPTPAEEDTATPEPTPRATPTPTAAATPTPSTESGGLEGFRAFAVQIEAAVKARDADFFLDTASIATVTCPNASAQQCDDKPAGSEVHGIYVGPWRSEGTLLAPDEFRQYLASYLNSLDQPTLYAIATLDHDMGGLIGGPAVFAVVVSADDPQNSARVFEFIFTGEGWQMSLDLNVSGVAGEWLSGECSDCYDHWERWEGTP